MHGTLKLLFLFAIAAATEAQTPLVGTVEPDPSGGAKVIATFEGKVRSLAQEILGVPYSAEQARQEIQSLPDGSKITRDLPSIWMFRDSQGRRRMERTILTGPEGEPGMDVVEIRDFVGGYEYTLDVANGIAHRVKLPADVTTARIPNVAVAPIDPPLPAPAAAYAADRTHSQLVSLGVRTIEGSPSEGRMVITTMPPGTQGNDHAITQKTSTWFAQDLKLNIVSGKSDGVSIETISRLVNIKRKEPDPNLFRVPDDYRLVDEEDRFNIEIHRAAAKDWKPSRDDEFVVRKLITDFADTRNTHDAAALVDFYADAAIYDPAPGYRVTGRAQIRAAWETALSKKELQVIRTIEDVRFLRPDVALVKVLAHVIGNPTPDFEEEFQLGRNSGHWQVRFHRNL